jgi:hypothetical protein
MNTLAKGCLEHGHSFYVIGDAPSPENFSLEGCDFYSLERQRNLGFKLTGILPERHYSRKNIGYLLAIQNGSEMILETDDDNDPYESFWRKREQKQKIHQLTGNGWTNVYQYFTDDIIWPRGLPLDAIHSSLPNHLSLNRKEIDCPIQQGLVNGDPDVDAIYRMIFSHPTRFSFNRLLSMPIALSNGSWCPFNSQNTAWFPEAFPLLYLPSYCSIRMTDIWRSFIAQRIAWENGWSILFSGPDIYQDRNKHDLMKDFSDEVVGYLHNRRIGEMLAHLPLRLGVEHISENLLICYRAMIAAGLLPEKEMTLLEAWIEDVNNQGR